MRRWPMFELTASREPRGRDRRGGSRFICLALVALVIALAWTQAAMAKPLLAGPRSYETGSAPLALAVGQVDGDGRLDLVAATYRAVLTLPGAGDATFGAPLSSGDFLASTAMAMGDLNGDHKLDVATGDENCVVLVLLGNGDGTFQRQVPYFTGCDPTAVAIGDLNHDGKLDLAVARGSASTISVLLGRGDGTFG